MKTRELNRNQNCKTAAFIFALIACFTCSVAWAENAIEGYELSFVSSQAHGDLIDNGRYRLAIHLLDSNTSEPLAAATNLCVAHTLIGSFRDARRHCNRAVELSEEAAKAAPENEREENYKNWVVALSNRGVLRAIRDQEGAEEDFRQATELRVYSDTAARNLARFSGTEHPEIAAH